MTHDPEKPQLTEFRANPTRTDAGRRIDTWTILLVDGEKVEADVMLHAGHMSADFSIVFKTRELAHVNLPGLKSGASSSSPVQCAADADAPPSR